MVYPLTVRGLQRQRWVRISRHRKGLGLTAAIALACATAPSIAHAHFTLDNPPSWWSQDTVGGPQKMSPCGDEGGGTPTRTVTAYHPGETVVVKWTEIVAHDGWFRIALSYADRADLMDPPYQLSAQGISVDAGIESPPVAPVLVDGLYPHTAASLNGLPKSYSYSLTLPMNPCSKCTLQVIQIMLNHPNNVPYGYTYHHCADISIGADAGVTGSGSTDGASNSDGAMASTGAISSSAEAGEDAQSGAGANAAMSGKAGSSNGGCAYAVVAQRRATLEWLVALSTLVGLAGLRRTRARPRGRIAGCC